MHHPNTNTPSQPVVSRSSVLLHNPRALYLVLLSLALLVVYVIIARIPNHITELTRYLILYGFAFIIYVVSIRVSRSLNDNRQTLLLILLPAFFFRVIFLTTWPTLSTDYYRYRWDGRVAESGINPYLHCPGSPHLKHLRDSHWQWINNRGTNTPYPPMSQMIFALAYRLGSQSPLPFKLILLLFESLAAMLILKMLGHFGFPRSRIIIYAWCPLVVLETFSSAHQDILGITLTWTTLYLSVVSARQFPAGMVFTAASLVKFYTLPLTPLFLHKKAWRFLAGMAIMMVLLYFPYLGAGTKLLEGFIDYANHWRIQAPMASITDQLLSMVTVHHGITARILSVLILLLLMAQAVRRNPGELGLLRAAFTISAASVILVPTFYPWYLLQLVPFLCFFPNSAWVLFTGTAAFCYLLPMYGFSGYVMALEYLPVFTVLVLGRLRGFSGRSAKM